MPANRIAWVDCAKGLSIVGVCLMHVVTGTPGGPETWLGQFSEILDPVRMPLFFLVSGLFSHRVLERSLTDLWFRRIWFLLIPYLVFSPFQVAIRLNLDDKATPFNIVKAMIVGDPALWFLYALIVYNILAWALRKVPPLLAVILSAVPLMICISLGMVEQQWPRNLVQYIPVFFVGLHYRSFFFTLSKKAFRPWTALWGVGLFAVFECTYRALHATIWSEWSAEISGQTTMFALLRNLSALPMGVLVGVWLAHIPIVRTILEAVGRNTLPVYASHHIMLHVVNAMIVPALIMRSEAIGQFFDHVWIHLLTSILTCVVSGVAFYWIGKLPVIGWILYPPPLRRRSQEKNKGESATGAAPAQLTQQ